MFTFVLLCYLYYCMHFSKQSNGRKEHAFNSIAALCFAALFFSTTFLISVVVLFSIVWPILEIKLWNPKPFCAFSHTAVFFCIQMKTLQFITLLQLKTNRWKAPKFLMNRPVVTWAFVEHKEMVRDTPSPKCDRNIKWRKVYLKSTKKTTEKNRPKITFNVSQEKVKITKVTKNAHKAWSHSTICGLLRVY